MLHAIVTCLGLAILLRNNFDVFSISINASTTLSTTRVPSPVNQIKECTSVDIRNDCESFLVLEGCTVVTGYVIIALIPNQFRPRCQYDNYTFPLLREITEYMIFFDVRGLMSVRNMFPNLTVIRGQRLFFNYALGMTNMAELRLLEFKSLVAIQRGHVYIGSSPKLCQIEKINWDRLTLSKGENHIVVKPNNNCTQRAECKGCDSDYCWSNFACQRFQNDNLADQRLDTTHCHEQCLGGCYNETNAGCVVCKGLTDHGICVNKCPEGRFLLEQFQRCYTREECLKKPGYLIFGTSCVPFCPSGLKADANTRDCVPCDENEACISTCAAEYQDEVLTIYSLSDADDIRGCQIVNSSLIITIRNEISEQDLISRFSSIREIRGYLKIFRSSHLTSLKFLSSLQRIHGDPLEDDHYGVILYDNKNLKELWKPEQLELMRGGIFMQRNNKLCNRHMREFQENVIHDKTMDTLQMNDQEVLCGPLKLNLIVNVISHHIVELSWLKQQTSDEIEVIYRLLPVGQPKFPETELDMSICTRINWQRRLVFPHELNENGSHYNYRIDDLTPNTRYSFLLRTFGGDYKRDARSDLKYTITLPDIPTPPIFNVVERSNTSLTFNIKNTQQRTKEQITHYVLSVFQLLDDKDYLDHRNYCKQPSYVLEDPDKYPNWVGTDDYDECCVLQMEKEKDERFVTAIRDEYSCSLDKKQYCHLEEETLGEPELQQPLKIVRLNGTTSTYVLDQLENFRMYSLQLQACNSVSCSSHSTYHARTSVTVGGELLPDLSVCRLPKFNGKYFVRFSEPKQSNALIVSYVIHYRINRPTSDQYISYVSCITRQQHEKSNFLYINSVNDLFTEAAVRVHSLAGDILTDWQNITICTNSTDLGTIASSKDLHSHSLNIFLIFFILGAAGTLIWVMYKRRCWRKLPTLRQYIPAIVPEPDTAEDREILVDGIHTVRFQNNAIEY